MYNFFTPHGKHGSIQFIMSTTTHYYIIRVINNIIGGGVKYFDFSLNTFILFAQM